MHAQHNTATPQASSVIEKVLQKKYLSLLLVLLVLLYRVLSHHKLCIVLHAVAQPVAEQPASREWQLNLVLTGLRFTANYSSSNIEQLTLELSKTAAIQAAEDCHIFLSIRSLA